MNKAGLFIALIGIMISLTGFSQDNPKVEIPITVSIPAIALLDFEGGDHLITFNSPNQVEQLITPTTEDKTWINYSSIVESGSTNYITVHISSGNLPAGSVINVETGKDIGAGAGKMGIPMGKIQLSWYPQSIITEIGSCFTGRGINKGHQLSYSWENIEGYSKSIFGKDEYQIAVTYTITSTE